jgi:hypothetical protein
MLLFLCKDNMIHNPNSLSFIPKNEFSRRTARVKELFDRQPNIKQRVMQKWMDERPDLAKLKPDQLMVRIAIDYLKKWEEWLKENQESFRLPHERNHGEMPVHEYENRLHQEGCPIPVRADKRAKYDQAMDEMCYRRGDFQY